MTTTHKSVLFHLLEKIHRTGHYYRRIASISRSKAAKGQDEATLRAKAEELDRCARDCDYSTLLATSHLSHQDRLEYDKFLAGRREATSAATR